MVKFLLLPISLLLLLYAAYYYFFYPPVLYKREAQRLLSSVSIAVETQNTAAIGQSLSALLAENAQVELELKLPTLPQEQAGGEKTPFSKTDFLHFMDNTLYSLSDYHFKGTVQSLTLSADKKSASLVFETQANGRDIAGPLSDASLHMSAQGQCTAQARYSPNAPAVLSHLSCVVVIRHAL